MPFYILQGARLLAKGTHSLILEKEFVKKYLVYKYPDVPKTFLKILTQGHIFVDFILLYIFC